MGDLRTYTMHQTKKKEIVLNCRPSRDLRFTVAYQQTKEKEAVLNCRSRRDSRFTAVDCSKPKERKLF